MAIQPRPPTPLLAHISLFDPADKKRKRDKKGKKVLEEGEVIPKKDLEPQKGAKIAKRAQRKSSTEGMITEMAFDRRPKVPIWNPPLEVDGAPLPGVAPTFDTRHDRWLRKVVFQLLEGKGTFFIPFKPFPLIQELKKWSIPVC